MKSKGIYGDQSCFDTRVFDGINGNLKGKQEISGDLKGPKGID